LPPSIDAFDWPSDGSGIGDADEELDALSPTVRR
jgi:hypothetical protein